MSIKYNALRWTPRLVWFEMCQICVIRSKAFFSLTNLRKKNVQSKSRNLGQQIKWCYVFKQRFIIRKLCASSMHTRRQTATCDSGMFICKIRYILVLDNKTNNIHIKWKIMVNTSLRLAETDAHLYMYIVVNSCWCSGVYHKINSNQNTCTINNVS